MKLRILVALPLISGMLLAQSDSAKRLEAAAGVLAEVMGTPDKSIPQGLLGKAQCAIIIPDLKKGAFIVGAKYGKGYVTCRKQNGVGWSAPGTVKIEGGSFGFQIGGSETDVIMLVMNERGMRRLLTSKFTLGADASVAAGPVGRTTDAQTDAFMTAEILSWSRSRGVFAGVSLQGATLRQDKDGNRDLYGKPYENRDLILRDTAVPQAAAQLIESLNKYSGRK
jgi:lipid-binding SYLF domain-containing protein